MFVISRPTTVFDKMTVNFDKTTIRCLIYFNIKSTELKHKKMSSNCKLHINLLQNKVFTNINSYWNCKILSTFNIYKKKVAISVRLG